MKHQLLSAIAAGSLVAIALPQGELLAQSRAAAEAAMAQMGIGNNSGMDGQMTYASAEWSNGRYILNDVVISDLDDGDEDEGGDGKFEVGDDFDSMRVERLIFEAPRVDDGGHVVFDGFAFEGITGEEIDGEVDVMRVDRFGVSGMNSVMAREFGRLFSGRLDPNEDEDWDWSGFAFDRFSIEGVNLTGDDGEGPYQIALEQFAMQGYSEIELGLIAIHGLVVDAPGDTGPVAVRLDEMSLTGFQTQTYSELMDAITSGAEDSAIEAAYYQSIMSPQMQVFDQFAMRGLLVDAEGVHIAMDNMTAQISQQGSRYISDMALDSLRIVPDAAKPAGAQMAMGLGMLGYERLELRAAGHSIYDEATGRAWTEGDNFVELADGLRIEFSQEVSGYDAYFENMPAFVAAMQADESEEAQAEAMLELLGPLVLHNFTMRIVDMSLLDRALTAGAAAQGITPDELRVQAGAMIGMGLMSAPPEIPRTLLSQTSMALTNFVNQGGSITFSMAPPQPLPVSQIFEQLESESFDVETLGLTVTAEAP